MFCLPPLQANKFIDNLKSGKIDPEALAKMSSEERHNFLANIVGKENAQPVNALFESKLLLKNQQKGMITWAEKVAGMKPETKRDIISRIQRLDRVLDPQEEQQFLKDLASTKLGVAVSRDEAKNIAKLSQRVAELESKRSSAAASLEKGFSLSNADLEYGRARYDFQKYMSDLKNSANRVHFADLKGKGAFGTASHGVKLVADISKSIGASLDDSFALRQGIKTFWVDNKAWRKEFIQSFKNIVSAFKNTEAANREFHARLMGDPQYDQAIKDGLALTRNEDVFPTSLPEKIPVAGRAFGASEVAYNAFAQNLRLNLYKQQIKLAEKYGGDVPKEYGKNMAKMVNSLTGRGSFGKAEPVAGSFNVAFYSLRFLKSNFDTLLLHPLGIGVSKEAQRKAAMNLVKIVAGTAATLEIANTIKPGSVDFDPRSSNFGKIRVGNTRFDVSGGMGTIVQLAIQQIKGETKSATTGKVTKLNSGDYGAQTRVDNVLNFFENKASPVGGVVLDYGKGKDHQGNKPTAKSEVGQLVTPLGVKNFNEVRSSPNSANITTTVIADALGISANTYGQSQKSWSSNPTVEVKAFQKKVSPSDFKKANTDYNNIMTERSGKLVNNSTFKALPDDQKTKVLNKLQTDVQKEIFKKYNYTYKRAPVDKNFKSSEKALLESTR